MDCPDLGVCNPSVIQPNVRRQATLNRDTDSVVVLTPNIKLLHRRPFDLATQRLNRNRSCVRLHRQSRLADADGIADSYDRSCFAYPVAATVSITNVEVSGGADRDRTGGLLVANQALSQLSYSPTIRWWAWVELNYRPHPYQGCALAN